MKTVVNKSQVAHLFANQSQETARMGSGNFYFNGPICFSYRDSYPVAVITPWRDESGARIVVIRADHYSPTTAGHIREVRAAFRGHAVRIVEPVPAYGRAFEMTQETARALAKGDADALRALAGCFLDMACNAAALAVDMRSPDVIAAAYLNARKYVDTARMLATCNVDATRAILADVEARAPVLPVMPARVETSWRYYAPQPGQAETWAEARAAALEFHGDAVREKREAERNKALRAALDSAEASLKTACALRAKGNARAAVSHFDYAAGHYVNAAAIAKKQKRGAAVVKQYRDAAADATRRADKYRDAAALATVADAADKVAAAHAAILAGMRRGHAEARHGMPSPFVRRGSTHNPHGLTVRGFRARMKADVPTPWREARDRAFKVAAFGRDLAAYRNNGAAAGIAQAREAARYDTAAILDAVRRLETLGATRRKSAAAARDAVQRLRDVTISAHIDANAAIGKVTRRRAWIDYNEARLQAIDASAVTLDNAAAVVARIDNFRRDAQRVRDCYTLGRDPMPGHAAARLENDAENLRSRYTLAQSLASVAAAVNDSSRAVGVGDSSAIRDAVRVTRARIDSGMALDAERLAAGALNSHTRAVATVARRLEKLDALADMDRSTWHTDVESAVNDALASLDVERRDLDALADDVRAVHADAVAAANAARADALGHWRRTGETVPGLWNSVPGSTAYFRFDAARDMIRSNLGAEVSQHAGRRLWALMRHAVATNTARTWPPYAGPAVGPFRLERVSADGSAKIGCHYISAREAEAFARFMRWPPFGDATDADALPVDLDNAAA